MPYVVISVAHAASVLFFFLLPSSSCFGGFLSRSMAALGPCLSVQPKTKAALFLLCTLLAFQLSVIDYRISFIFLPLACQQHY
jgi:hypothetical protein